jgi:hypothetical protein
MVAAAMTIVAKKALAKVKNPKLKVRKIKEFTECPLQQTPF